VHNHRLPSGNKQFSCNRALCACEVGTVCPTMGEYHPGTPGARVRVVCRGCGAVRSHFEGRRWVHNHRLPSGNKQFSCNRALCACEVGSVCPTMGAYHPPIPHHLTCPAADDTALPLPSALPPSLASAGCRALAASTGASTGASIGASAAASAVGAVLRAAAAAAAHLASAAAVLSSSSEPAAAPSAVPVAAAAAATPALVGNYGPMTKAAVAPLLALAATTQATPALSGLAAIASATAPDDATPAAVSSPGT
jgi:hypothetical protein